MNGMHRKSRKRDPGGGRVGRSSMIVGTTGALEESSIPKDDAG